MSSDKRYNTGKTAIVLATGINGLGAVRSLRKAGFDSIVITGSGKELAALSRLHSMLFIVSTGDNWENDVREILDELRFDFKPPIISCSDRAADFVAINIDWLSEKYSLLIPGEFVTRTLNDKKLEIDHMKEAGVPIPKSLSDIPAGVTDGKLTGLDFPVIIKPRTFAGYELINAKNIIVTNDQEWDDFHDRYKTDLDELIAQEVIAGADDQLWVCNATFNRQSVLVSAFTFQRLGTMPSHFGVTSMAISQLNERVIELCEKIGAALKYVGPAMFEFKFDENTEDYLYIETNPRLGMCNWFDTSCGINNVEATCLGAMNLPAKPRITQDTELVFWNVLGDFVARLEDRESIRSILELYFRYLPRRKVWAIFLKSDVRPFISSFTSTFSNAVQRIVRRLVRVSLRN